MSGKTWSVIGSLAKRNSVASRNVFSPIGSGFRGMKVEFRCSILDHGIMDSSRASSLVPSRCGMTTTERRPSDSESNSL
jgi:hypothetical protein